MSESDYDEISFKPQRRMQIFPSLVAAIGAFSLGNMLGWTSPALEKLREDSKFPELESLDNPYEPWIASVANIGALIAGLMVGNLISSVGRKKTLLFLSVPFTLSWVLLGLSQNVPMLIAGRFFTGFFAGAYSLAVPIYVSEIAEDSIRGTLLNSIIFILVTGILFTYVVGAVVSWVWLSLICAAFPILLFIAMFFFPDTPRFLLEIGETEQAYESLMFYRGATVATQVEAEFEQIEEGIEISRKESGKYRDLLNPNVYKPLGISMALFLFQQLGGINAVIFYSVDIFNSAGTDISSHWSSIAIGATQVVFVAISTFLIDRTGRRILLIISSAGMAVSICTLGAFFYLKENNENVTPEGLGWLPLTSLIVYICTYNIALGPIPWVMMGELIPPHVKGKASGVAAASCWLLAFIVTMTFKDLELAITSYGCYWLFGGICVISTLFSIFIVPETQGKTFEEIQQFFT